MDRLVGQWPFAVTDTGAGQRPVDDVGGGPDNWFDDLVAAFDAWAAEDVLGAVLADRLALEVLPRLHRSYGTAFGAHSRRGHDTRHLGDGRSDASEDDVDAVAALRCAVAEELGVHRIQVDDLAVVADGAHGFHPCLEGWPEIHFHNVFCDDRVVLMVFSESHDVPHGGAGALCGLIGQGLPEQVGLGVLFALALRDRVLRARR